jgi:hypothetical protein
MSEKPNPKRIYGTAKPCPHFIPPIAIIEESVVMALGAKKYGEYNWQDDPVDASTYYSAAMRHLMAWFTGERNDPESGCSHLAHARACLGILIDAESTGTLIDDRPLKSTNAAAAIKRLTTQRQQQIDASWAEAALEGGSSLITAADVPKAAA